ncbi:hypothetical protein D3C71_1666280 [compost metagenome]
MNIHPQARAFLQTAQSGIGSQPASKAGSTDSQIFANGIAANVGNAVTQAMTDLASKRDAGLRDEVAAIYGRVVANSLAGEALAELARQCKTQSAPATNAQRDTGAPDPAEYFSGMRSAISAEKPDFSGAPD